MGQYYMPTLIDRDDNVTTLYSHEYDNGLKLMEHSWMGNNFVDAVITQLWKNPQKVAWIGDYSDDFYGDDAYEEKIDHEKFHEIYKSVWSERDECKIHPDVEVFVKANGYDGNGSRCYLVNHTTKQYIDLVDYYELSGYKAKWMPKDGDPWCVHPLPLLTACGNDRGGGDFHSKGEGYDLVGIWAFDELELTNIEPISYDGFLPCFKESDAA